MLFLFTQSKCHINIVLNWSTFSMVKSMAVVSEEHAELNEILFTLKLCTSTETIWCYENVKIRTQD